MTKENKSVTRREFIIGSIGLVATGGIIGLASKNILSGSSENKNIVRNSYREELEKLTKVDPSLINYQEIKKIDVNCHDLKAVTVDSQDRIYIASDKSIQVLNRDISFHNKLNLKDTPRCLTISENGDIYAGMRDHVEIYDLKGGFKSRWENLGGNPVLTSLAVSDGNVFVADAGNRKVLRFDSSGKLIRQIDGGREAHSFTVPSPYFDLAVSPDGLLRVANPGEHRIEAFTFDGDLELAWGNASLAIDSFCGCCNPVNFAILPDGRFVTSEKGVPRIKVYKQNGRFESVVATRENFAKNAANCANNGLSDCKKGGMDVTVDSTGRIVVMDPIEKNIRIFERINKA
ncbi:hypothetical protein GF312_19535 [Candidatus Poribacteria bacterium]|nr:hypothetical protein [Candidatus Poribacteria bacterium]